MHKKPNSSIDAAELRRRAEEQLRGQQRDKAPPRTDADTQRLLHELQVHQIELEMQNAELLEARDRMETMVEKYTDLYDFAPVGYFSLNEQGVILEANLTGATLLGVERSRLIKRRLHQFLSATSQPVFLAFLERVFTEPGKQVCEASLPNSDRTPFCVNLLAGSAASLTGGPRWCRMTVSDITALKRSEEAQHRVEALDAANREMRQEIVRRKAVEADLKKSEKYSRQLLETALQLQKQLQHLSHQVLQTQEEERKRISHELHDEIGQVLTAISFHLASLKKEATPGGKAFKDRIAQAQRLVEQSVDIVHQFAVRLRPAALDDLGLIPTLESHVKDFAERTGLSVRFTPFTHGRTDLLDGDKRMVLYRVVQEALTNIAKHAHASLAKVSIRRLRGVIRVEVKDNGKSFDVQGALSNQRNNRLGLLGMRERVEMVGGRFAVESARGKGTTIRADVPYGSGTEV